MQIEQQLTGLNGGTVVQPYVTVTCLLAREGGDLHLKNFLGASPLQYCPQDISVLIFRFWTKIGKVKENSMLKLSMSLLNLFSCSGKVFHGTLPRFTPPTPPVRVSQTGRQQQVCHS